MTNWQTAADDYAAELARRQPAKAPSTIADILESGWSSSGRQTIAGLAHYTNAAIADLEAAVSAETGGKSIAEFTGVTVPFGNYTAQLAALQNSLGKLPEDARVRIAPLIDVTGRAAEKAQADEEKADDTQQGIYNLGGQALSFAASMARQAADPANIAMMPLGGPLKGPLLKVLLREAALGMAITTVPLPAINAQRAQLDLSAVENPLATVVSAGIGSAAFAGLFRLGAAGYRAAVPAPPVGRGVGGRLVGAGVSRAAGGEFTVPPERAAADFLFDTKPRLDPRVSADDLAAAALLAERDQVIDAGAVPRTPAGRVASAEKVDAAAAALEQGKAAPTPRETVPRAAATPELPFAETVAPPATTVPLTRIATRVNDVEELVLPGGRRVVTRPAIVELSDITVSHTVDGNVNPRYPAELQPRDRSAAASRSFIAEKAAELEPKLLGHSVTVQEGAPIVGPDMVVESGNARTMMLAVAYDRHPERAAAYRQFLQEQGYDVSDFKFPVLVRIRESDVADRAAFTREANVSTVAGLSAREQAVSDAKGLTDDMLALWTPGETGSAANARFVRAFADRIVAPEERPQFVGAGNRLSAAGKNRIDAAMVARGWGDPEIVGALFEDVAPTSRAILGAMADTAPEAARLKVAIAEGRVPVAADPLPALLEAYRLVERARSTGLKVGDLVAQIDLEKGAVSPEVAAAARLYFRDDDLRVAAGRDVVAARINRAIFRALDQQNAVADMFGDIGIVGNFRVAKHAGESLAEQPIHPAIGTPAAAEGAGPGRFHGTDNAALVPEGDHYSTKNYYGQGFYTTDASAIATGYAVSRAKRSKGEPIVYGVTEREPVKVYDMEAPITPELMTALRADDKGSLGDFLQASLDENPKNLRELYDTMRDNSAGEGFSADEIQEVFTGINDRLLAEGYGGMSHIGGLRTNKPPHKVIIYFNPEKDITIAPLTKEAAAAAATAPAPAKAAAEAPPTIKGTSASSKLGPNGTPYAPPPGLAAQAEAALAALPGGDLRVIIETDRGVFVETSARQYLKDADDIEAAAGELAKCITSEAAE